VSKEKKEEWGYQLLGKDKRGVFKVVGKWKKPPILYLLGSLFYCFLIVIGASAIFLDRTPVNFPELPLWIRGLLFLVSCGLAISKLVETVRLALLRIRMRSMLSEEELRSRLGMPHNTFKRLAKAESLRPRLNLNGEDYYRMSELENIAALLRPASNPDESEQLLRVVQDSPSDSTVLLRSTNEAEA
jgi:hypothetical protein